MNVPGVLLGGAVVGGVAVTVVLVRELRRRNVGGQIARVGTGAAEQAGHLTAEAGRLVGSMLDWSGSAVRTTAELAGKGVAVTGRTVASATGSLLGAEDAWKSATDGAATDGPASATSTATS